MKDTRVWIKYAYDWGGEWRLYSKPSVTDRTSNVFRINHPESEFPFEAFLALGKLDLSTQESRDNVKEENDTCPQ